MDEKRRKALSQFHLALEVANLIEPIKKLEWKALGYLMSNEQLEEAQKELTEESLQQLKIEHQLKKLKQNDNATR